MIFVMSGLIDDHITDMTPNVAWLKLLDFAGCVRILLVQRFCRD